MSSYDDAVVLITGGAGFIGSHLAEELVRRNARVTVVDNLSSSCLDNLRAVQDQVEVRHFDLCRGDIRAVLAQHRFDYIFHLAGHTVIPDSVKNPREDLEKNALATFDLLEAIRDVTPLTRVVFSSSAAVYGEAFSDTLTEDASTVPVAPYGVSKLTAERYMNVYARVYGLRAGILRLFPVYGPRLRKLVIYDLMRKVHENPQELFIYGDGTQVRDFNYVTNAVEAFLAVAERAPLQGEVYNVAAEEPISIGELARMICERMGAEPRFVYSGDVRPGESQRWQADISRLKGLGYRPRMTLAAGLDNTVAWFRREATVQTAAD